MDNNDQVIGKKSGDIFNYIEGKMLIIKPNSNEKLKISCDLALSDLKERYPEKYNLIEKFKVEFNIRYAMSMSLGSFDYIKTTEPIAY